MPRCHARRPGGSATVTRLGSHSSYSTARTGIPTQFPSPDISFQVLTTCTCMPMLLVTPAVIQARCHPGASAAKPPGCYHM
jgi:hypothetical protein